jgi:hypothetical protein
MKYVEKSVSCLHCCHLKDLKCTYHCLNEIKFVDDNEAAKFRCYSYEFSSFLPPGYTIKDHRICCTCEHWDGSFCDVTRHHIKVFGYCDNYLEDCSETTNDLKSLDELEKEREDSLPKLEVADHQLTCDICEEDLELNGLAMKKQDTGKVLCESCIKTAFLAYEKKVLNKL